MRAFCRDVGDRGFGCAKIVSQVFVNRSVTMRREAFYWLTILFTFALGTAVGDLVAERFSPATWRRPYWMVSLKTTALLQA